MPNENKQIHFYIENVRMVNDKKILTIIELSPEVAMRKSNLYNEIEERRAELRKATEALKDEIVGQIGGLANQHWKIEGTKTHFETEGDYNPGQVLSELPTEFTQSIGVLSLESPTQGMSEENRVVYFVDYVDMNFETNEKQVEIMELSPADALAKQSRYKEMRNNNEASRKDRAKLKVGRATGEIDVWTSLFTLAQGLDRNEYLWNRYNSINGDKYTFDTVEDIRRGDILTELPESA